MLPTPPAPEGRVRRAVTGVRRAVLRRRRLLAAAFAAVAVVATLRAVADPAPPTVGVVVAARDLPAGTRLEADDLTTVRQPPATVPDDVVADPAGEVLAGPVRRGEPVTDVRLVGAALVDGLLDVTAMPVRLPDAAMVDLLDVGDRLDLVAADPRGTGAELVAADVPVLAVPAAATGGPEGVGGRLVVLGVASSEVDDVAAATVGSVVGYTWSPAATPH